MRVCSRVAGREAGSGLHCTGVVQTCSHLAAVGHPLRCSEEVVDETSVTHRPASSISLR